jgi:hypothetical protein
MDILSLAKKTRNFKQLYSVPYNIDKGEMPADLKIAMHCNPCYGFGDIIFCLKLYKYIKDWYGIEPTLFVTKAKPFLDEGISDIYLLKVPGQDYEECDDITKFKLYSVNQDGTAGRRISLKTKYDLILVTPWVTGGENEPDHKLVKYIFPYSNRFNTFIFSEYNPSYPSQYDFPTGIGKNLYGLFVTDWKITGPRLVENPYLMVHMTPSPLVNVTRCFSSFIKLMVKKYNKKHPVLDVILPAHVLDDVEGIDKLAEYVIRNGYYDDVDIIRKKGEPHPEHEKGKHVLRFRSDLTPMPYESFISLFNYCLPDVLITGDQSLTDIVSCCKKYTVYYQIMPWKANLAKNMAKVTGLDIIGKVRSSCGLEKLSKKLNLYKIARDYDFRKLGKPRLDILVRNARLITTDPEIKAYVKIVLGSRKKTAVISKYENYLGL